MKRRLLITTVILSLVLGITAFAGSWTGSYESGWRYQNDNGSFAANGWMQDTDGLWYYFGADGIMLHDTWVEGQYYLGSTGAMLTNSATPDGYYVGADGKWIPGAGQQAAQTSGTVSGLTFNEVVEVFRLSFAQASNESIQATDIHGENNNTIAITLNITDSNAAGLEELFVYVAESSMEEAFTGLLDEMSREYGQKIYLRVTYMVNGRAYSTKTY